MKRTPESKAVKQGQGNEAPPAPPPPPARSLPLVLRWIFSKTVRHATAMRKHVHRLLCAQRDILSPQAIAAVGQAVADLQRRIRDGSGAQALVSQMESLEKTANKWLKPYPHAAWRENVEVLLVALAVAMGIRTFFL